MMPLRVVNRLTHPTRMTGPIIEAPLNRAFIGEVCEIRRHWRDTDAVARAQVIGFRQDAAVLSLLGSAAGCSRESVLVPTGRPLTVRLGDDLLGAVVDSTGRIVGRIADARPERAADTWAALEAPPPSIDNRLPIRTRFLTGVRAIDGLMTCGIGQRVGIFAEAGTGKTTLSKMLIDHASADVSVIGLIGERGREVTELVEELSTFARRERTVIVFSTSDAPAVDRCNAAPACDDGGRVFPRSRDERAAAAGFVDAVRACAAGRRIGGGRSACAPRLSGVGVRSASASSGATGRYGEREHYGVLHGAAGERRGGRPDGRRDSLDSRRAFASEPAARIGESLSGDRRAAQSQSRRVANMRREACARGRAHPDQDGADGRPADAGRSRRVSPR
ncbi:Flagellar biosynthesis/type III secretory pathway ATPase [Burkholderia dolosa AU0158]|nr:Flagellar biosynthesis/type III secretory pathway ATPase [Burkholderia dolosa AU0158]